MKALVPLLLILVISGCSTSAVQDYPEQKPVTSPEYQHLWTLIEHSTNTSEQFSLNEFIQYDSVDDFVIDIQARGALVLGVDYIDRIIDVKTPTAEQFLEIEKRMFWWLCRRGETRCTRVSVGVFVAPDPIGAGALAAELHFGENSGEAVVVADEWQSWGLHHLMLTLSAKGLVIAERDVENRRWFVEERTP